MTKPKAKTKRAASLVIHQPGRMTQRGRRDIATWMRRQASFLLKYGNRYTEGRFTAGFNYSD